jgi:hypothetical protein
MKAVIKENIAPAAPRHPAIFPRAATALRAFCASLNTFKASVTSLAAVIPRPICVVYSARTKPEDEI